MRARILLDTLPLLKALNDDRSMSLPLRSLIQNSSNQIFYSAISILEIDSKKALGRIRIDGDLGKALAETSFEELPITGAHSARASNLPLHHNDLFDRILIAQAEVEELLLVTYDPVLTAYPVLTLVA